MCGAIPLTFHAASYSDFAFAYFSELARRDEDPWERRDWQQATLNAGFQWCVDGRTDKWHATHPETSLYSVSLFNNSITYSWDFVPLFCTLIGRGWLIVVVIFSIPGCWRQATTKLLTIKWLGSQMSTVEAEAEGQCGLTVLCLIS